MALPSQQLVQAELHLLLRYLLRMASEVVVCVDSALSLGAPPPLPDLPRQVLGHRVALTVAYGAHLVLGCIHVCLIPIP